MISFNGGGANMKNIVKSLVFLTLCMPFSAYSAEHIVEIVAFSFQPAEISAAPGDTIVFVNRDQAPHSVIPRANSEFQFSDSQILNTGDEFTLMVEDKNISGHCGVHLRMPGFEVKVLSEEMVLLQNIKEDILKLEDLLQTK